MCVHVFSMLELGADACDVLLIYKWAITHARACVFRIIDYCVDLL